MPAPIRYPWIVGVLVMLFGTVALASGSGGEHYPMNWFDFSHWIGDNPNPTAPLIALLFNFAILVILVARILRNPMRVKFQTRRSELEAAFKEASELKETAQKAISEARARREAIDEEMNQIRKQVREAGEADAARIIAEAEDRAERLRADTQSIIEHEIALYTQKIRQQVVAEVVAGAEEILKKELQADDVARLNKEYVDSIGSTNSVAPAER